jgi:hypothetical protein
VVIREVHLGYAVGLHKQDKAPAASAALGVARTGVTDVRLKHLSAALSNLSVYQIAPFILAQAPEFEVCLGLCDGKNHIRTKYHLRNAFHLASSIAPERIPERDPIKPSREQYLIIHPPHR